MSLSRRAVWIGGAFLPLGLLFSVIPLGIIAGSRVSGVPAARAAENGCPPEMVRTSNVCIDRWEISLVDKKSGRPLSPYYPPVPSLIRRILDIWQIEKSSYGDEAAREMPLPPIAEWQIAGESEPMAVSRGGVAPQGYLSRDLARRACQNAGKRLCQLEEWKMACRGQRSSDYPYGSAYKPNACNVNRLMHGAMVLHDNASLGHLDPRINLIVERGTDPLLRDTGATKTCASEWGKDAIYDMVGNLDEWIEDDGGGFVGGFYARNTTRGCDARVKAHPSSYLDYSTGTRCCKAIQQQP